MRNTCITRRLCLALITSLLLGLPLYAYSLKHYTAKDGLSNNAITAIFQDEDGFMWFGTNRGVKQFDGRAFHNLPAIEGSEFLVNDAIGDIYETSSHVFWILTNGGLTCLDYSKQTVQRFEEFDGNSMVVKGSNGEIFAVKEDNYIYCFRKESKEFEKIPAQGLVKDAIVSMFVDTSNTIWVITEDDNHRCYVLEKGGEKLRLTPIAGFRHTAPVLWSFYDNDEVYFVDDSFILYEYSISNKTKNYIQDLRNEVARYGDISSIIKHQGDYYLAFAAGGMFRVKNMPDHRSKYLLSEIAVPMGISCLKKDSNQEIIWVGTRDKGVYMYYEEASTLEGVLSSSFNQSSSNPINALYIDRSQTLWIATGGNGITTIREFSGENIRGKRTDSYTTSNSMIGSGNVHSFAPSSKNLLWIATESGVSYYSYSEYRMKNLQFMADNKPVRYLRSICEVNDTVLWMTTAGEGIVKAHVAGWSDSPIITGTKRYVFGEGNKELNNFTTIYQEDHNTLWFGTLGRGVYKVNTQTEAMENIQFGKSGDPINEVYSILRTKKGYWFGTGGGLAYMSSEGEKQTFTESNGFLHEAIHGILEGKNNILWLSTTNGIVKFDIEKNSFYLCRQSENRKINNFSNESFFKDPVSGMLLFGGSNGFVLINESDFVIPDYSPEIKFTGLALFGQERNIYEHLTTTRNKSVLTLNNDQNVFAISFVAPDYVDGKDYTYFYKLNEQNDNWINNGTSNAALFTYLASGKYTFMAKYRNNVTGKESAEFPLTIRILHPWYKTLWIYLVFIIIIAAAFFIIRWFVRARQKKNTEALITSLNQMHQQDIYRSKLAFFSDMANQIYNSLTFILNPSKKLLAESTPGSREHTYANTIYQSGEQMNRFVHELIEYRQIVMGDRVAHIRSLLVSELADTIAEAFIEQAETKKVDYQISIASGLYWNSDYYCLTRIITHLLSVSFGNVEEKGAITIKVGVRNRQLYVEVSSSAEELFKKNFERALDYFKIVDLLEEDVVRGHNVANELTLALANSMVVLIGGKMDIHKSEGGITTFITTFPNLEILEDEGMVIEEEMPVIKPVSGISPKILPSKNEYASSVLVLTDIKAVLWLLTDQFLDKYNVEKADSGEDVLTKLATGKYFLLIAEADSPNTDTIQLVKVIKERIEFTHISCVLLASDNSVAEKTASLEVADFYLQKPYDMEVLDKEIDRLTAYKQQQQYYTTTLNQTLELDEAQYTNNEDKEFYDKMLQAINKNIANKEFSVGILSAELGLSTHQLYRRLKKITEKTPNEIIRESRLNLVEKLLVSTNLLEDEIMEKAGFASQNNFFQVFSQKHGITPKIYREQKKMSMKKRK